MLLQARSLGLVRPARGSGEREARSARGGGGGGGGGAALGAAAAELLPAEVSLHLTGPALVLHASCASSSAVSGQLVGPVTLHALDAARHQVCGAHFEPRLAARRPQTAEATAAAAEAAEAEAEAGAGAAAAGAASAGAVQCTIERTEWQRSPSGACELAQVWLRLSGEPGEVELTLQDAARQRFLDENESNLTFLSASPLRFLFFNQRVYQALFFKKFSRFYGPFLSRYFSNRVLRNADVFLMADLRN